MTRQPFHFGPDHHLKRAGACPSCSRQLTGATAIGQGDKPSDNRPKRGDATICIYCGALLVFTRGLKLRHATEDERREIGAMPTVQTILMAQAAMSGKKPS